MLTIEARLTLFFIICIIEVMFLLSIMIINLKSINVISFDGNHMRIGGEIVVTVRLGSGNQRLLSYLFENQDTPISVEEVEKALGKPCYLSKVIDNLRIPKHISKRIFHISDGNKTVIFSPAVLGKKASK